VFTFTINSSCRPLATRRGWTIKLPITNTSGVANRNVSNACFGVKVGLAGLMFEMAQHVQLAVLQHGLQRAGNVLVMLRDFRFRFTGSS